MTQKIVLGVLAFNEENHIENVIQKLLSLKEDIVIIDDFSSDRTEEILKQFENIKNIKIIRNKNNLGAGSSTKILLDTAKQLGYTFLVKIDGDDQFAVDDVQKIINLHKNGNYQYIKSNRYWDGGIVGDIPKIRFFGNLVATFLMQLAAGSRKLFDPLNGLFGVTLDLNPYLNDKVYPTRYGYPYFFTLLASLHGLKTYQINNVVNYGDQSSQLNSIKVFFTILKLTLVFYIRKLKIKKTISSLQKSALYDIFFVVALLIFKILISLFLYIVFYATSSLISTSNLLILIIASLFSSLIFFNFSFKEETRYRDKNVFIE